MFSQIINLLKLRIGVVMMLTALVAMAVTPGQPASALDMAVLAFENGGNHIGNSTFDMR